MKFLYLTLNLLLLSVFSTYAQSGKITVTGSLPNRQDGEIISFDKPIGSFPVSFYLKEVDDATVKNQSISANLSLSHKGLIYLYEKPYGTPTMSFYAEPGDTIIFKELNGQYFFEGKNAKANDIYANRQIYTDSMGFDNFQPVEAFAHQKDEVIIDKYFNLKKVEFTNKFKMLFDSKEISSDCFLTFKDLIDQQISSDVAGIASGFRDNKDAKQKFKCVLSTEKLNNLISSFVSKYDDGDTKINFASKILGGNIIINAKLKEYNLTDKGKLNDAKWHKISKQLGKEYEEVQMFDLINDDKSKEMIFGRSILLLLKLQVVDLKNTVQALTIFKENFPNSVFINPIIDQIQQVTGENIAFQKIQTVVNYLGNISFFNAKTGLSVADSPIKSKSFEDLMQEKFKNESVFIDGWATYCGPCIKEFKNSNDLRTFLRSKNIETLYISVDQNASHERWRKMIADYELNGYHLFASDKLRDIFNGPFQYIPSYYFYSKGKLKKIEGKPSDKETFYLQFD